MANILAYLGMHLFGGSPASRKRERKRTQVNTRDYWSGTTTTLESDDEYEAAGLEELIPQGEHTATEEAAELQNDTAASDAAAGEDRKADDAEEQALQEIFDEAGSTDVPADADDDADSSNFAETVMSDDDEPEAGKDDLMTEDMDLASEDALLGQIEQFRQQAARLQKLMQDKEARAKELENLVEQRTGRADELQQLVVEREGKADELEQLVAKREEAAKGVTEEVAKRLDGICDRMEVRIDQAQENVRGDILDAAREEAAHSQLVSDAVAANGRQLESLQESVTGVASDAREIYTAVEGAAASAGKAADNTDEIRTDIRELSDQTSKLADSSEGVRKAVDGISDDMAGLKENMSGVNTGMTEMTANVAGMSASVDGMAQKADGLTGAIESISVNVEGLSEHFSNVTEAVHSESVKNYRNTADLFKEMGDRLDQLEAVKKEMKGIRRFAIGALVFAILSFLAAAGGAAVTVMSVFNLL